MAFALKSCVRAATAAFGAVVVAAALTLSSVGNAAAGVTPPVPPPVSVPPGVLLDTDAHPAFTWSVPDRYVASWAAYNKTTSTYNKNVINPTGWGLNLNGCASTSKFAVTGYEFTVAQLETNWHFTHTSATCRFNIPAFLPAQGRYTVSLRLKTFGSQAGISLPTAQTVTIRDYLIVSLGDSLASGEGSPDVAGNYSWHFDLLNGFKVTKVNRAAVWKDTRCHRSANSGPARAAQALENADPHTSVTFVSFACSGAEIKNLVDTKYQGIQKVGTTLLRPQIDAAAELVGPTATRHRPIDSLLLTAGLNDLHFSDIVDRCAHNHPVPIVGDATDCVTDGGIEHQLAGLPRSYRLLAQALRAKLSNAPAVYINDYPAAVLDHGGCGILNYLGHGVGSDEGHVMTLWGERMNIQIRLAAAHSGWHLVGGMEALFKNHDYCATTPWFVKLEQSYSNEGSDKGTLHPNSAGAGAFGAKLRSAIRLG